MALLMLQRRGVAFDPVFCNVSPREPAANAKSTEVASLEQQYESRFSTYSMRYRPHDVSLSGVNALYAGRTLVICECYSTLLQSLLILIAYLLKAIKRLLVVS